MGSATKTPSPANHKREINLDNASAKVTREFTRIMVESALNLSIPEVFTAAALKVALISKPEEDCQYELRVLREVGLEEVARVYKSLLFAEELSMESMDRYTSIISLMVKDRMDAERTPEESEKSKPDRNTAKKKREPHHRNQKERIHVLIKHLREIGLREEDIGYVEKRLSEKTALIGTAENSLQIYGDAAGNGVIKLPSFLNYRASVLFVGPKRARELVDEYHGNGQYGSFKQTESKKPEEQELKSPDSAQQALPEEPVKKELSVLDRLRKIGLQQEDLEYLKMKLEEQPNRTGTANNCLDVIEQAAKDGIIELPSFLNERPSLLFQGPKFVKNVIEAAKAGRQPFSTKKPLKPAKPIVIKEVLQEHVSEAAQRLGFKRVPNLETSTRSCLTSFFLRMIKALEIDQVKVRGRDTLDNYLNRCMTPVSGGGKGYSPRRYIDRLVVLINSFGPKGAKNRIVQHTKGAVFFSMPEEEFASFMAEQRKSCRFKSDKALRPLVEVLKELEFDKEYIGKVKEFGRTHSAGIGIPAMVRRIREMADRFGVGDTRCLLEHDIKILTKSPEGYATALDSATSPIGILRKK